MADFVAVLKKTIDGMGESTPSARQKIYDKARATVESKLAAISPPPTALVADRQRRILEDAIARVEADYASPAAVSSDPFAELESVFARSDDFSRRPAEPAPAPSYGRASPAPAAPQAPADPAPVSAYEGDEIANDEFVPAVRKRSYGSVIAALVAVVVIMGGGYAVWLNADAFSRMLGLGGTDIAATDPAAPASDDAAAPPAGTAAASATDPASENQKFTQRLNADGSEIDEGPAGGVTTVGEGTSVSSATQPPSATSSETTETTAPAASAVAVGQKAIFYEERTNVDQGSADTGDIVWTLIQQSPGGDAPAEPAIRAEARIPGKDIQLRMTISRNKDTTLPASHIIELIFLTPEDFEGGGIENILRFTMKDSEQAAGNPLFGIPAKIADGFFLVALNDTKAETEANLRMLLREKWIDVPLVYKSGRRALITLEKGVPGEQVFNEAIKAWQTASATPG
ncbi:MAG: hypothetical protein KF723_21085 [Rhizobiaceae bacterium]|nr:hypothetical protein [Rhizobiaceae bacterium]